MGSRIHQLCIGENSVKVQVLSSVLCLTDVKSWYNVVHIHWGIEVMLLLSNLSSGRVITTTKIADGA